MKKLIAFLGLGVTLTGCSFNFSTGGTHTATNANTNVVVQANVNAAPALKKVVTPATGLLKYTGNFFDVLVPGDFEASPALQAGNQASTDEARFSSPDGTVEFFVYSPQWGGPNDYFLAFPNEKVTSKKTDTSGMGIDKKILEYVTMEAKDGSYTRSTLFITSGELENGSQTQHGFGIKYRDQTSYDKYKEAYTKFKESLVQYADGYVEE